MLLETLGDVGRPPGQIDGQLAGLLLGWLYIRRLLSESYLWANDRPPFEPAKVDDLLLYITAGVVLGGRLGFVIFYEPSYYLQNFHFQSGGWMTPESARRYDTQVEVLFNGSANATRRQALVPLAELFAGRDQRRLRVLDVGCGTGRFLDFLKQAWPRLPALGLDMSEAYVAEAKRHLARWCWTALMVAKAEAIPVPDASQDAVTSIFVFHELPPKVRRAAFGEFARVLRRGGRLVLVDSLQLGDEPDYDGMLELFPQSYHEPYYAGYLEEDFGAIARACGLTHVGDVNAFYIPLLFGAGVEYLIQPNLAITGKVKVGPTFGTGDASGSAFTLYALVGKEEPADATLKGERLARGWPWRGGALGKGYDNPNYTWGFGNTHLAINPATKKVLWKYQEKDALDSRGTSLAANRLFFYSHGKFLGALDTRTGKPLWKASETELQHAIGERFPAFHARALAPLIRDQLADWRQGIEILDDDA